LIPICSLLQSSVERLKVQSCYQSFLKVLEGPWDLIADEILLSEYKRYASQFNAKDLLTVLQKRMIMIEQSEQEICRCRQFFSPDATADIIHAAACLHTGSILISNDAHFKDISEAGIIEVWTIAEAIERLRDYSNH